MRQIVIPARLPLPFPELLTSDTLARLQSMALPFLEAATPPVIKTKQPTPDYPALTLATLLPLPLAPPRQGKPSRENPLFHEPRRSRLLNWAGMTS